MPDVYQIVIWEVFLFLIALAASVFVRLLDGGINTNHLLDGLMKDGTYYFSPERVQLLLFTIWTAGSYLLDVLDHRASGKLPDVSQQTLLMLSGSHAIYLGGKMYSMLLMKPTPSVRSSE